MEATEDNVVGTLFLQNGEDNGYDPEDFVLEIDVGSFAPHFHISVADDDGGIPGSLFACAVWHGARLIATYFARHHEVLNGRKVVEFGAASALPSLVALHAGAKVAVMTDYPNDILLRNIKANITRNAHLLGTGRHEVRGHLWGSDTIELLKCLEDSDSANELRQIVSTPTRSARFDVAIVAECLWLHDMHQDLLKSINACLSTDGKVFVSFAHHVPGHEHHDLSFFTTAKNVYGFDAIHIDTVALPHIFNHDRIVKQYLYILTRSRTKSTSS
ncbi:hypothetical protein CCR75_006595 [Bremia lactucae]|uniref:Calmodulin-lysine N-methyltransferase n=1 Tax=Bremia lactucae TaxID=4779 RepID=A0A976FQY4_BRELC|nr:hypothetical protein CCR75_006595 [Bremia lactucae]